MITIIDYGLGNIRSLMNWFSRASMDVNFSNDLSVIQASDLLILPGVGAYEDAMKKLKEKNLVEVLDKHVSAGKPLVGICLGMQLLYDSSYEGGYYKGLGFIPGDIVPFDEEEVKVPQMGWNTLTSKDERFDSSYVYFVHSYYAKSDFSEVVAYTEYDVKVPAIVKKDNVLGFQFHPEKSGDIGQDMLVLIKELEDDYISSN
ncbi:imidazole glycerol phosphate synthase subunit HisH [Acidaminobacter sp. JC074]|uniref:imidazole glycerol phosphate synthase subunit HisH n=1 Tax=Acidaminobacter sp. JC074 TaxID=2530199 RepID=UPI001F0D4B88|nr:imidazole glycerol phosphate synthase subunit HisH [Acidaminobacter sp. JC074]MCH4888519.1 imidazole glycerol phosphate synthase subunit HisH [Acidaminobacter sp. JC074]